MGVKYITHASMIYGLVKKPLHPPPLSPSQPLSYPHLRLRDMYRLTRHQAPTNHKQAQHGVKLAQRPRQQRPQRQLPMHPPLTNPVRHQPHNRQRRRDRRALKVGRLARRILGHVGDGDVEAREAGQAAQHEEGEDEVVGGGAEADCEGGGGGGDAEGDLFRVALAHYPFHHPFTLHSTPQPAV